MDRYRQWQMVVGGLIVLKTCTYFCIRDALMNPMKEVSVDIQHSHRPEILESGDVASE
jgi:hypothetical protein